MTREAGAGGTTPSGFPRCTSPRFGLNSMAVPLALAMVGVSTLGLYGVHRYGSFSRLVDYINGETLVVDENKKALGVVPVGESRAMTYEVTNLTDHPLKFLGIVTACSCTAVEETPDLIQPRAMVPLRVRFTPQRKQISDRYTGKVKIFTDDPHMHQLELIFEARVISESGFQEQS